MTKKHILAGLMILVISSLLITACGGAQPTPAPTVDTSVFYTQAAQTLAVSAEKTKAAQPPATETPEPTATLAPTNTIDPNISAALTATANAIVNPNTNATAPAAGAATQVVIPTATKAVVVNKPPANTSADKCAWVSNDPADNSEVVKNALFNVYITVKNTGTTTWNNKYALRYFAGERMGAPDTYQVQGTVAPGANYTFNFTMTGSSSTGSKEVFMVVQNSEGQNMCMINMPLKIIEK